MNKNTIKEVVCGDCYEKLLVYVKGGKPEKTWIDDDSKLMTILYNSNVYFNACKMALEELGESPCCGCEHNRKHESYRYHLQYPNGMCNKSNKGTNYEIDCPKSGQREKYVEDYMDIRSELFSRCIGTVGFINDYRELLVSRKLLKKLREEFKNEKV
jgi:hypothetical protein